MRDVVPTAGAKKMIQPPVPGGSRSSVTAMTLCSQRSLRAASGAKAVLLSPAET